MRPLVYTCVLGGYDRVFPPIRPEPGLDHVIFTDDASLKVPGWRSEVVDMSRFTSVRKANRYYKMLAHRVLPHYDSSLYVDGNVRLLGKSSELFQRLHKGDTAMVLFRHGRRASVTEEIAKCLELGKIADPAMVQAEVAAHRAEGFPDDRGLVEATILLKNHRHPALDPAMALWWEQFERFGSRDQFSLPYVLWKTALPVQYFDFGFREPNSWFGVYPHRGAANVRPAYADLSARAYGSRLHWLALKVWQAVRALRRAVRRGLRT